MRGTILYRGCHLLLPRFRKCWVHCPVNNVHRQRPIHHSDRGVKNITSQSIFPVKAKALSDLFHK